MQILVEFLAGQVWVAIDIRFLVLTGQRFVHNP